MRPLKLSKKVYEQYKRNVRGNEGISFQQAEKKFLRNMILGKKTIRKKGQGTYVQYGKLHFIVSDDDVVVWMKNYCPTPKGWKRDNKRYLELNKELGIEDDTTMLDLIVRDSVFGVKRLYGKLKWKIKNYFTVQVG